MRTSLAIITIIVASGCHKSLPSIRPEELRETKLAVSVGDHSFDVVAALRTPVGYQLMQTGSMDIELARHPRDPRMGVITAASRELTSDEPDESWFIRCDSSTGGIDRILRDEVRADGRVRVCEHREADRRLGATAIIRDVDWRGHHFQCWVSFAVNDHVDEPYDEGKPSDDRLTDAIAICDSFTIREMTPADIDRFYPLVNGHRPYTPLTQ